MAFSAGPRHLGAWEARLKEQEKAPKQKSAPPAAVDESKQRLIPAWLRRENAVLLCVAYVAIIHFIWRVVLLSAAAFVAYHMEVYINAPKMLATLHHALSFMLFAMGLAASPLSGLPGGGLDLPVLTQYLGRWTFLTAQTNALGTLFYGLSCAAPSLQSARLDNWLLLAFPGIFALGCFLTLAYYLLDHNNPDQVRRRNALRGEYPKVDVARHLEHAHGLPLVLVHAALIGVPDDLRAPRVAEAAGLLVAYMTFYVGLAHVNRLATGEWPYPILTSATRKGGAALRSLVIAGLVGFTAGLAVVCTWYLQEAKAATETGATP